MNYLKAERKSPFLLITLLFLAITHLQAQEPIDAQWIAYPTANNQEYGVYNFRKVFKLKELPQALKIRVSADNRYNLFVNGNRVSYGPAKGDLKTYKYDIVDIAPYLIVGENVLGAQVHNAGKDRPLAFFTAQTAFMLSAEDPANDFLDTDESWKVMHNDAYSPISYYEMVYKDPWFYGFYACGPGDDVNAKRYPWGWDDVGYDDSLWQKPEELTFQKPPWNLVPRNIAFMADYSEKPAAIRRIEGMPHPNDLNTQQLPIAVPANSNASILFDFKDFTMGYPQLQLEGGEGSSVKIKYAEALYESVNHKGNRDSIAGLTMYGVWDIFRPDGNKRTFRPLWKRAFRYIQLEIETKGKPLKILDLENEFSGYPYKNMATFKTDNDTLNRIFKMSQRTLRMCSAETYYDTPYYEQLSYGGDNRPISNISIYNSTDDRLLREVLRLYPQSRNVNTELFKSAYPSQFDFDMGTWSLSWAQALSDYYTFRGDKEYISQFIDKIEGVLRYYDRHIDDELGILGTVYGENFMDWSITKGSIPRQDTNKETKNSIMLTLFYLHTLDTTVSLFKKIGLSAKANLWQQKADKIRKGIKAVAWDDDKKLFRETPDEDIYTQHSNILAILTNVINEEEQKDLMHKILEDKIFKEYASSFFSYYLFMAMDKVDMQEELLDHLDFWKKFIHKGFTTVGETGFAAHDRSDCHAWSAHPAYYFLSMTAGIKPATDGFQTVKIEPHLGEIDELTATIPHPMGKISVSYTMKRGKLWAKINLPINLKGTFIYNGRKLDLVAGENLFKKL